MKPRKVFISAIKTVLPLAVLVGAVFGFSQMKREKPTPRPRPTSEAALVKTDKVQKHDGLDLTINGVVVPYREITLSAEVAGRIVNKAPSFRAGRFVKKGTVLLEIFDKDYELEKQRLIKQKVQAENNVKELDVEIANAGKLIEVARADLDLQQKNLNREARLRGTGAAAERDLDEARKSLLSARNALIQLQNQERLLRSRKDRLAAEIDRLALDIEKAQLDLDRTKIKAPIDGVIVQDNVEQSSYVAKGKEVAIIEDTSRVEVRCHLRVSELAWLWSSTATPINSLPIEQQKSQAYSLPRDIDATVKYHVGDATYEWTGALSRYESIGVDERSRTVPCRVLVKDPQEVKVALGTEGHMARAPRALMRGMYVQVVLHAKPAQRSNLRLLAVPEKAVHPGNEVYKFDDGKLKKVTIARARTYRGLVVFDATSLPISEHDRVIVSPVSNAENGMKVKEANN